jgi:hypothetical protein
VDDGGARPVLVRGLDPSGTQVVAVHLHVSIGVVASIRPGCGEMIS